MVTPDAIDSFYRQLEQRARVTIGERMLAFIKTGNSQNGIFSVYIDSVPSESRQEFEINPNFDALVGLFFDRQGVAHSYILTADNAGPAEVYKTKALGINQESIPATPDNYPLTAQNIRTTSTYGMPAIVLGFAKNPNNPSQDIITLSFVGGFSPRNAVATLKENLRESPPFSFTPDLTIV